MHQAEAESKNPHFSIMGVVGKRSTWFGHLSRTQGAFLGHCPPVVTMLAETPCNGGQAHFQFQLSLDVSTNAESFLPPNPNEINYLLAFFWCQCLFFVSFFLFSYQICQTFLSQLLAEAWSGQGLAKSSGQNWTKKHFISSTCWKALHLIWSSVKGLFLGTALQ